MPQPAVRRQRSRGAGTSSPTTKPRPMSWKEAVDQFLATKESENLSPATIENYAWHLGGPRARAFLADHQVSSPRQLTADALRDLQRELLAAGVSPALAHAFHRVQCALTGGPTELPLSPSGTSEMARRSTSYSGRATTGRTSKRTVLH
jgi:hypothetical protein